MVRYEAGARCHSKITTKLEKGNLATLVEGFFCLLFEFMNCLPLHFNNSPLDQVSNNADMS
jgi:hypothetical protein